MSGTLARVVPAVAAALAGASIWISLGNMAVIQADSRMRIVALPPWYILGLLMVAAAAASVWRGPVNGTRLWPLAVTGLLWLPYVPGHVPDAFLIWQGPIEGLVWLTVAAGLMLDAPWSRPTRLHRLVTDPAAAPWAAGVLSAILFAAGALVLSDHLPNGDEPHYLMISQSLLHDGDLRIQNNHDLIQYQSFASNALAPHYVARGVDGQIYSVHAPGVPVLVLPGFALFGYPGASATVIGAAAVTAGLMWRAGWLLTASAMAAWWGWAAVCLAAPFFLHTFMIFPEMPGALCVTTALALLLQLELRGAAPLVPIWLAGAALAALPWLHSRFVVLAAALGVVLGLRLARQHPALAARFLCIPVISAIAWFGYFWTIWGTVDPAAPYYGRTDLAWRSAGIGMLGLMGDQRSGLLPAAPVLASAVAGTIAIARRRPRLAAEIVAVIIPYVAATSAFTMWWGGVGGPARYLVAILPIAALPVAWMWSTGGPMWRALIALLVLTGAAMLAARTVDLGGAMALVSTYGSDPFLAWAAPSVDLSGALLSLRSTTVWRDALAWVVVGAVIAGGLWLVGNIGHPRKAAAWLLVSTSAAVALMVGSTVVWRFHAKSGLAPAASQVAFVRQWSPQFRPTALQWRPSYIVPARQLLRRIDVPMILQPASQSAPAPEETAARVFGAGDYTIVFEGTQPLRGEVEVRLGDTDLAIDRLRLDDLGMTPATLPLRLPLSARGVRIHGDEAAIASALRVSLRVADIASRPSNVAPARRAVRFGDLRAFFLDDRAYPEPAGFWTRGEAETTVILDRDDARRPNGVTLLLQSGPIATTVDLAVADGKRRIVLSPHQRQEVSFPVGSTGRTVAVSIRTGAMFLPVQHDAGNRDFRQLGVWVEVR